MKIKILFSLFFIFIIACQKGQFATLGDVGEDPFFPFAWHIHNSGQRYFDQGKGLPGYDIQAANAYRQGLSGKGVHILISDTGVDYTHPDLAKNHSYGLSLNFGSCIHKFDTDCELDNNQYAPPLQLNSQNTKNTDLETEAHGTEVAGVIAAHDRNQIGSRGIAPRATISASNFLSKGFMNNTDLGNFSTAQIRQMSEKYDIINQSWGKSSNQELSYISDPMMEAINKMISDGRNDNGTILVRAAGNYNQAEDLGETVNAIFEGFNNTPYSINVGALNARGIGAWYSLSGANLWISAPGGDDQIAGIVTTDISGCINGESNKVTNIEEKSEFQIGKFGNGDCNYSDSFIGTSAAAPVVTGAIALILEKYPNLNWREVKYVLAASATQIDKNHEGWQKNAVGLNFHHKYGFGALNVDGALAKAAEINHQNFQSGKTKQVTLSNSTIKLNKYANSNDTNDFLFSSAEYDDFNSLNSEKISAVQLQISTINSGSQVCDVKELNITITSPLGTISQLTSGTEALYSTNYDKMILLTNAFYQETAYNIDNNGVEIPWKVKISDTNESNSTQCTISELKLIINY